MIKVEITNNRKRGFYEVRILPVDFEGTIDILLRPCVVFPLSTLGTTVSGTPKSMAC